MNQHEYNGLYQAKNKVTVPLYGEKQINSWIEFSKFLPNDLSLKQMHFIPTA